MKHKAYIQPQSLSFIMKLEQIVASSPTLDVKSGTDNEVTDLENDAATNRKGFAGDMWDYMK